MTTDSGRAGRVAGAGDERAGAGLRYVRTLFGAEDDTCFHIFEATSREAVAEAASRAGFLDARVTEAIQSDETTERVEDGHPEPPPINPKRRALKWRQQ